MLPRISILGMRAGLNSSHDSGGINSAVTISVMPAAFESAVGTADFVAQDFNPGYEGRFEFIS